MEIGSTIIVVFQGLMALVLLAGIPWAFSVHSNLSKLNTILVADERRHADSDKFHDQLNTRIRKLEFGFVACPICSRGHSKPKDASSMKPTAQGGEA